MLRRDTATRLLVSILLVIAASVVAWGLAYGLGVQRVSMIYLIAVLFCAAMLGVSYAIVTAIGATVAFNLLFGPAPPFHLALGTRQDIVNVVVFVGTAWVTGIYADELRRGYEALARLARLESAADIGLERPAPRVVWVRELAKLLAALGLAALAAAVALAASQALGMSPVSMIFLTAVVAAAMTLGTRFALITAVSSVLAFDVLFIEPRFTLALDTVQAAANLVIFSGTAWVVGVFAEQVRHERQAVRSLFAAGRSLSATADEPALRWVICNAVGAATGGRAVVIRDENGAVSCEAGSAPDGQSPGWRTRPLAVEGGVFGSVAWYAPPTWAQPNLSVDRTVHVMVDIGAAAIARARLGAENARMEVIARTEELRRALLASVSHDVRTPLAGILGSATSLLDYFDRYDDATRKDLLSNIREQAHRLNRYIDNLLGMTRLEAGALEPKLQPVALEPLVIEAWETIADLSAGRAPPRIDLAPDLTATADPALLRQALGNLLENAVKYGAGGEITVCGETSGDTAVLSVMDEGPGVPAEDLARLFQPFARGQGAQEGGFGLGLFIARSFMEAMGGSIIVGERKDGRSGLAVRLALPRA